MQPARLTVVCASYRRHAQIPVLIHSLMCQTLQNFKLLVIHDGDDPEMRPLLSAFKTAFPDRLDFHFTEKRHNDFGHSLRETGIRMCDSEFILLTNDDNYYVPTFLELMFRAIDGQNLDMALCDMVHSHDRPGRRPQEAYGTFVTHPSRGNFDVGCVIVKSRLAKTAGFRDKSHDGDATYLEDILSLEGEALRIGKVAKVLFVHN